MCQSMRLVGAVDAVERVAKVKRPSPQADCSIRRHETRQMGIAFQHLWWRTPIRPFRHAADPLPTGPRESNPSLPTPISWIMSDAIELIIEAEKQSRAV